MLMAMDKKDMKGREVGESFVFRGMPNFGAVSTPPQIGFETDRARAILHVGHRLPLFVLKFHPRSRTDPLWAD